MESKVIGVIPARYASSRFPGKPLAKIEDRSMIQEVYERCCGSKRLNSIIIAVDDTRIFDHVRDFGARAIMTGKDIETGTDRCWAAVKDEQADIIVNIQGDEPLVDPAVIDMCVQALEDNPDAVCATPVRAEKDIDTIRSVHTVKTVFDHQFRALYFSRSPIPFPRESGEAGEELASYVHIGLYAYRREFLKKYVSMERTPLERRESLEQLRIIENGYPIICCLTEYVSMGIDTPEDLERLRLMRKKSSLL